MARPDRYFDWQWTFDEQEVDGAVGTRERSRVVLLLFAVMAGAVLLRAVQLEVSEGQSFRDEAARPLRQTVAIDGERGRILARDGTVLACDQHVAALAMHYRYLENPPDPQWLRQTARARLTRSERRLAERVAAEERSVVAEQIALHRRLTELCGLSEAEWQTRTRKIQRSVSGLAERVNRRRLDRYRQRREEQSREANAEPATRSLWARIAQAFGGLLSDDVEPPPPPIVIAEQRDYHVVVDELPANVVEEIKSHAESYPGVQIREVRKRLYPGATLAAHVVGHLGGANRTPSQSGEAAAEQTASELREGRLGIERQYEQLLRPRAGSKVQIADRRGNVLSMYREHEPHDGSDLVLSLDPELERTAESLLDRALRHRAAADSEGSDPPVGGAIVVMDVETGEILAAASAPRFDPNLFEGGCSQELEHVLGDPRHPLFDRACRMAIPPGSVFKTVSAIALLQSSAVEPLETFECQGYLHEPDRQRCAIYQRYGVGHGDVALVDALAQSCNVYFFHFADRMGAGPLLGWAERLGFGQPSGIDLPNEASGNLPQPVPRDRKTKTRSSDDAQSLAIGQSSLTATPLQIVRLMAAVANGGRLVTPRLALRLNAKTVRSSSSPEDRESGALSGDAPRKIAALKAETLATVREGLRRVVADPSGTAYGTVRLQSIAIAGKTGTAQTGVGRADHAWFAGYVPDDAPRVAFVVVLEHGGSASKAGPLARRLVLRMQELGYFGPPQASDELSKAE